jgi:hypothetical protein
MAELYSDSGVYVYPKDIRICHKKKSGTSVARHLLSVFYKNTELVAAGNLTRANGKIGLNKCILEAIVCKLFN